MHFSRSWPSNSWWQTMVGWQVLSRPSAAEGGATFAVRRHPEINGCPMLNRNASRPPHTNPANTVVLAGAGISLDWPSCFPIGSSIVSALAAWLGDGDAGQTARAKAALSVRGANPYSFIRFEQIWETLELLVPGISSTMESLELFGAPNANHHVIADFLDHGGTLVTTNFDRRIEQALRERGMS